MRLRLIAPAGNPGAADVVTLTTFDGVDPLAESMTTTRKSYWVDGVSPVAMSEAVAPTTDDPAFVQDPAPCGDTWS